MCTGGLRAGGLARVSRPRSSSLRRCWRDNLGRWAGVSLHPWGPDLERSQRHGGSTRRRYGLELRPLSPDTQ